MAEEKNEIYGWELAALFALFMLISIAWQVFIAVVTFLNSFYDGTKRIWLQRLKEEVLDVGVISLALVFIFPYLEDICVDSSSSSSSPYDSHYYPPPSAAHDDAASASDSHGGGGDTVHRRVQLAEAASRAVRRVLASGSAAPCPKGQRHLFPSNVINTAHYLLFFVAFVHILYSLFTYTLTLQRFSGWASWERKARLASMGLHGEVREPTSGRRRWRQRIDAAMVACCEGPSGRALDPESKYHLGTDPSAGSGGGGGGGCVWKCRVWAARTWRAVLGGIDQERYLALRGLFLMRARAYGARAFSSNLNYAHVCEAAMQIDIENVVAHGWLQALIVAILSLYVAKVYQIFWLGLLSALVQALLIAKMESVLRRVLRVMLVEGGHTEHPVYRIDTNNEEFQRMSWSSSLEGDLTSRSLRMHGGDDVDDDDGLLFEEYGDEGGTEGGGSNANGSRRGHGASTGTGAVPLTPAPNPGRPARTPHAASHRSRGGSSGGPYQPPPQQPQPTHPGRRPGPLAEGTSWGGEEFWWSSAADGEQDGWATGQPAAAAARGDLPYEARGGPGLGYPSEDGERGMAWGPAAAAVQPPRRMTGWAAPLEGFSWSGYGGQEHGGAAEAAAGPVWPGRLVAGPRPVAEAHDGSYRTGSTGGALGRGASGRPLGTAGGGGGLRKTASGGGSVSGVTREASGRKVGGGAAAEGGAKKPPPARRVGSVGSVGGTTRGSPSLNETQGRGGPGGGGGGGGERAGTGGERKGGAAAPANGTASTNGTAASKRQAAEPTRVDLGDFLAASSNGGNNRLSQPGAHSSPETTAELDGLTKPRPSAKPQPQPAVSVPAATGCADGISASVGASSGGGPDGPQLAETVVQLRTTPDDATATAAAVGRASPESPPRPLSTAFANPLFQEESSGPVGYVVPNTYGDAASVPELALAVSASAVQAAPPPKRLIGGPTTYLTPPVPVATPPLRMAPSLNWSEPPSGVPASAAAGAAGAVPTTSPAASGRPRIRDRPKHSPVRRLFGSLVHVGSWAGPGCYGFGDGNGDGDTDDADGGGGGAGAGWRSRSYAGVDAAERESSTQLPAAASERRRVLKANSLYLDQPHLPILDVPPPPANSGALAGVTPDLSSPRTATAAAAATAEAAAVVLNGGTPVTYMTVAPAAPRASQAAALAAAAAAAAAAALKAGGGSTRGAAAAEPPPAPAPTAPDVAVGAVAVGEGVQTRNEDAAAGTAAAEDAGRLSGISLETSRSKATEPVPVPAPGPAALLAMAAPSLRAPKPETTDASCQTLSVPLPPPLAAPLAAQLPAPPRLPVVENPEVEVASPIGAGSAYPVDGGSACSVGGNNVLTPYPMANGSEVYDYHGDDGAGGDSSAVVDGVDMYVVERKLRGLFWFQKPQLLLWVDHVIHLESSLSLTLCVFHLIWNETTDDLVQVGRRKLYLWLPLLLFNISFMLYMGWVVMPLYMLVTTTCTCDPRVLESHIRRYKKVEEEEEGGITGFVTEQFMRCFMRSRYKAKHHHHHGHSQRHGHGGRAEGALWHLFLANLANQAGVIMAEETRTAVSELGTTAAVYVEFLRLWLVKVQVDHAVVEPPPGGRFHLQADVTTFRSAFAALDGDGSGSVTCEELLTHLHLLGTRASRMELRNMIRQIDLDGDNKVDFHEFLIFMVFCFLDMNGNGSVEVSDLRRVAGRLMVRLTEEDMAAMVTLARSQGTQGQRGQGAAGNGTTTNATGAEDMKVGLHQFFLLFGDVELPEVGNPPARPESHGSLPPNLRPSSSTATAAAASHSLRKKPVRTPAVAAPRSLGTAAAARAPSGGGGGVGGGGGGVASGGDGASGRTAAPPTACPNPNPNPLRDRYRQLRVRIPEEPQ